jgi:hypothetical protein
MSNEKNKPVGNAPADNKQVPGVVKTTTVTGELSHDEIETLKATHGRVRKIKVEVNESDTSVGYFKYPDRNTMAVALAKRDSRKPLETGETLLNNCWIGGDVRMKTDASISVTAAMECLALMDFLESSSEEV